MLHERAVGSNQSIAIFNSALVSNSCPLDGHNLKRFDLQNGVRRFTPNTGYVILYEVFCMYRVMALMILF